jgi:hypothetical protein
MLLNEYCSLFILFQCMLYASKLYFLRFGLQVLWVYLGSQFDVYNRTYIIQNLHHYKVYQLNFQMVYFL